MALALIRTDKNLVLMHTLVSVHKTVVGPSVCKHPQCPRTHVGVAFHPVRGRLQAEPSHDLT